MPCIILLQGDTKWSHCECNVFSKENPFRYRICKVFCSSDDGFMDFDDFLDLVSVMSDHVSKGTRCLLFVLLLFCLFC